MPDALADSLRESLTFAQQRVQAKTAALIAAKRDLDYARKLLALWQDRVRDGK